ncbi:hypothetical protein JW890_04660, partial [candidate division WOR-3 bacterium]|nr:hypothetical protein [candidate division WOR-3 bacterium]
MKIFFAPVLFFLVSGFGCSSPCNEEIIINFRIEEEKIVEDENAWGWLAYANGTKVFLQRAKKPSVSFDLFSGEIREIGKIGEAPGEYEVFPSCYMVSGDTCFLGDFLQGKL